MREALEKVKIQFEIETCEECPFSANVRTIGAGMAHDYYCAHNRSKFKSDDEIRTYPRVMHYVECSTDEEPVPEWCPIRAQKIKYLETPKFKVGQNYKLRIGQHVYKIHIVAVVEECLIVYRYYGKVKQWWHYDVADDDMLTSEIERTYRFLKDLR